ncbi:MAG: hypothetical protein IPJ69_13545 [Deltaproteobacteria bacterium]|nr:MAG: hypothetical protein IPJ69_13545 [Deltaproteobacteria bacterium]
MVNETRLVNAETASVAQKDFKGLEVTSEKVLENTRENIGGNQEILVTRILTQESDLISHEINDSLDKSRFKAFIVVILSMTLLGYFLLKEDIDKGAVILPKPSPVVITKKTLKPPEVQGDASLKNVLPISSPSSPSSSAGPTKTDSKSEVSKLENLKKEKVVELKKENTKNGKVGFVSVQALPWGFVKIDGQAIQETPVIKKSLTVGVHTLEVVYEPDDSHLKTSIDVKENEEMMCVATFKSSTNAGERKIRCH